MIDKNIKVFLFIKDFGDGGNDRYFLYDQNLIEVSREDILNERSTLICHDSWLILSTLLQGVSPSHLNLIDLDDFQAIVAGTPLARTQRDKSDIGRRLSGFHIDKEVVNRYFGIFNRSLAFDDQVYSDFASALIIYFSELIELAKARDEIDRFISVEKPVWQYTAFSAGRGIGIDQSILRSHKKSVDHDFYTSLKDFSNNYNLPLEIPSDDDVVEYLTPRGFDFSGIDVDYMLRFVPMHDNFAVDLLQLRKIAASRNVLSSLPVGQARAFPIADTFGSITSRIYYKDPSLQSLAKRHRDIIIPDEGRKLCYVDYDQFEVGIMAVLSEDPIMRQLYLEGDLYSFTASKLFNDANKRKQAKRLFLSYAYGMNFSALILAAEKEGATRAISKEFFKQFTIFERWKASIHEAYFKEGKIGTSLGNYRYRQSQDDISDKEQRSAISQVIQGTASLIFKKALLALSKINDVELLLPMHDAMLLQVPTGFDIDILPELIGDVMFNHFDGKIIGKASIEPFFQINQSP